MRVPARFLFFLVPCVTFLGDAAAGEPVCIIKSNINLRKEPSLKSKVSWAVPKYMPFMKVGTKGVWSKIQDLDGKIHWVQSKHTNTKASCAVVKTKSATLREGPSSGSPLAEFSKASKYTSFLRTDRDGEWVQVRDDFGGSFWVHETNVWMPIMKARVSF